jgi:hypothetical protein
LSAAQLNPFERSLHRAASLVGQWATRAPSGDASIRDALTVDGLSLWDVMAPELSLYYVPDSLAPRARPRSLRRILGPYLSALKYARPRRESPNTSDCSRWPEGATALFIGFTPYLARDVLQPVIGLLRGSALTPVMLEAGSGISDTSAHSTHRHRDACAAEQGYRFAVSARQAAARVTGDPRYQQLFADDGRVLWPLVKPGIRKAFHIVASRLLPDTVAVARHVLEVHRPAVIVSIDVADPRTRVYSALGAALGIPTVQVQSGGDIVTECVEWRFLMDAVVAAQGTAARQVLLQHGVPAHKIVVTGSPRHDRLTPADSEHVAEFRTRFSIPRGNRAVLFASSYSLQAFENNLADTVALLRAMKQSMFAAVAAVPGVSLVVKPHPLENVAETRALTGDASRISFAEPSEDIRPLASACDAFFTLGSTATLDGIVLGKPTVCPAFPGWTISDLFIRTGAVVAPRSEPEIVATLREIAADGGADILRRHADRRREYLSSVVCEGGQGATRRIADLITQLASDPQQAAGSCVAEVKDQHHRHSPQRPRQSGVAD